MKCASKSSTRLRENQLPFFAWVYTAPNGHFFAFDELHCNMRAGFPKSVFKFPKKYGWFSFKDACFRSFQTSDSFFRRRYKIPFRWLMISHFLWIYHVFLVAVLFSTPNFFFEFWRTHLILLVIEAKTLKTLLGVEAQTIKTLPRCRGSNI